MKIRFAITLVILNSVFLFGQTKHTALLTVSGKVTQTSSYCGGARPSEEMMEQYNKPKPYAGKIFYVRKGKENNKKAVVLKFISDSAGNFSFQLPAGSYCIIQQEQLKSPD